MQPALTTDVAPPTSPTPRPAHVQFEYNSERIAEKDSDLGLLLYDMCVVDVDTKEKAAELEQRFPELRKAPAVSTARGMHYYFARSPLAVRLDIAPLDGPAVTARC